MFFVGFNIHAVMLMQERGLTEAEAGGVFLSISVAHAVGTLLYGCIVVDAMRDKRMLLVVNTAVACVAMLAGAVFHGMRMAHVFGVVFGAMHAMVFLSLDATIPHFFGTKHLGSISGLARGISFFGGASGPLLFDVCKRATGSYTLAMCICAALMAAAGCLACFARDTSMELQGDTAYGPYGKECPVLHGVEDFAEGDALRLPGGDEREELLQRV